MSRLLQRPLIWQLRDAAAAQKACGCVSPTPTTDRLYHRNFREEAAALRRYGARYIDVPNHEERLERNKLHRRLVPKFKFAEIEIMLEYIAQQKVSDPFAYLMSHPDQAKLFAQAFEAFTQALRSPRQK